MFIGLSHLQETLMGKVADYLAGVIVYKYPFPYIWPGQFEEKSELNYENLSAD